MSLTAKKTNVKTIGKEEETCRNFKIKAEEETFENVEKYKYLGAWNDG